VAHRRKKIPAQVVEDEEYQLCHEHVAGIDIAKAKADVCTRLPAAREGGRRRSRVEEVPAAARDVLALGARLLDDGVELVVMESTSDYWRLWYYLLESLGLAVHLVNSSHARQLAGRPKTDRLDAQWLARLAEMGLLRPSFVPPPEVRALRDLTRTRGQLVRDRSREWQRLEKLLEGALVKLSCELSSLARVKTARLVLEALAGGERDPGAHHARLVRIHLDHITLLDRSVAAIEDDIAATLEAIPAAQGIAPDGTRSADPGPDPAVLPAAERLAEIPGVSLELARAIIAETGLDMSVFPTAARLVSWAGLAPVARQSGPRSRKPKKGQGNGYLKAACTQAANGAGQTETFLGERLRRLSKRLGGARARCAVGRSILIIIWHLLSNPEARYTDLGADWHARKTDRDKKIRGHLRQLQALGVDTSTLNTAAA
jgi:transposase